jgi:hypothetical protein
MSLARSFGTRLATRIGLGLANTVWIWYTAEWVIQTARQPAVESGAERTDEETKRILPTKT